MMKKMMTQRIITMKSNWNKIKMNRRNMRNNNNNNNMSMKRSKNNMNKKKKMSNKYK